MSKQVPFERGDMQWLEGILNGQFDNMLSHGRTERIVIHIKQLEAVIADVDVILNDGWCEDWCGNPPSEGNNGKCPYCRIRAIIDRSK